MKTNDEVLITGGLYQGMLAYYVDDVEDTNPSYSNVQLQASMVEVQVLTMHLEPVEAGEQEEGEETMEVGDKVRFTAGFFTGHTGRVSEVRDTTADVVLDSNKDRKINEFKTSLAVISKTSSRHNEDFLYVLDLGSRTVQVHLNDMIRENEAYVSLSNGGFVIKGKEKIEEFIRAVAIAGDLIREDEELIVAPKIKFEVPEDGLYELDMPGISRPIYVQGGKCFAVEDTYSLKDVTEWVKDKVELDKCSLESLDTSSGNW